MLEFHHLRKIGKHSLNSQFILRGAALSLTLTGELFFHVQEKKWHFKHHLNSLGKLQYIHRTTQHSFIFSETFIISLCLFRSGDWIIATSVRYILKVWKCSIKTFIYFLRLIFLEIKNVSNSLKINNNQWKSM